MSSLNIYDQIKNIETRLKAIEKRLGIEPIVEQPIVAPAPPPITQERTVTNWLAIVAVICFVLAAGFIIKLSIDTGWLTPIRQFGLATVFGFSLIITGLFLVRIDKAYASFLPAAGIIVLYLTVLAAHQIYHLISFEIAITCIAAISLLSMGIYLKIRYDIYPLVAVIGAYVLPMLFRTSVLAEIFPAAAFKYNVSNLAEINANLFFTLYYFVLCSFAFAFIAVLVRSRLLSIVAAYLAIGMTAYIGLDFIPKQLIVMLLMIQFFIFVIATYFYTIRNQQPLTKEEAWAFFPVLLLFYSAEYFFIDQITPYFAPWISLGFATFLIGLYVWAKQQVADASKLKSLPMLLAFTTIVVFHCVYIELLPEPLRRWLFVVIMFCLAWLPIRKINEMDNEAYFLPKCAIFLILGIEYTLMIFDVLGRYQVSYISVALASFASIWLVLLRHESQLKQNNLLHLVLLNAAHLLAIVSFYRLTKDYNSLAVSASWLLYALLVILFSFNRKDSVMAKSALLILSLAAGKALLYDAASAPTIVRILCLLITGVVLYGSGLLLRKIARWDKN